MNQYKIPENKIDAAMKCLQLEDIAVEVPRFITETIVDVLENDIEIWHSETSAGLGFFAGFNILWRDDSLNAKSKIMTLREIVDVQYIYDDDSGWRRAEKLGLELKDISEELLASAERGKKRWP